MNQQIINKKKTNWQAILLTLVVVGLPAISFLVNILGAKTGKTFYADLKNNLGYLATFKALGWNNDTLSSETVKGKVLVVSFVSPSNRDEIMTTLKPIVKTEQFREEVDNLQFLTFDKSNDSTFYNGFIHDLNNRDKELWHFLKGGEELFNQLKIPNEYSVSLIDTAGVIRKFYDMRRNDDKRLLVEHISVMPIKTEKNIEKKEQKKL